MLHQRHVVEESQYHAMVGVVPRVSDGHILEQTIIRPTDVVRPGPHLLAAMEHATHLAVLIPWKLSGKQVLHHVL